jgi:CheY-like chemotaxis protein
VNSSAADPHNGLRVLVVDSDPAVGRLVTIVLQADRHRVVAVTSGQQALDRLRVDRFDVVVADLGIGLGVEKIGLSMAVRRGWPGVRFVPLTKPFRGAEMRRSVTA